MDNELTSEQITQIVRAARVLNSGFTEDQLRWLTDGQQKLADAGFCEAVWAITRYEKESGVRCAEVIDACEELLEENSKLEDSVVQMKERLRQQRTTFSEAEQRYRQLIETIKQSRAELAQVQADYEKEERKLANAFKRAEKEKQRLIEELEQHRQKVEEEKQHIDQEVDEYRKEANVAKQEITVAAELKAQVEKDGFSLEKVLDLSREFAGHHDAREKLAAVFKQYGSLTGFIKELDTWAQNKRMTLNAEISGLKSQRTQEEIQVASLKAINSNLENVMAQFQSNVADEEELRRFYSLYRPLSGLLDCLMGWKQIFFLRCNNPISAVTNAFNKSASTHFWTDMPVVWCPHCGSKSLAYDLEPYQALNRAVEDSGSLQLGG